MALSNFDSAWNLFLVIGFVLAVLFGAVINKTNFCHMGAVSDWVNIGDMRRFRAWMLAIATALLGMIILDVFGLVNADESFPPYRSGNLIWGSNILGGMTFGIGMTLASGCGTRTLVRLGGGNIKSIFVLLIIGVIAYFMINPFPDTDQTLFSVLLLPWISHLSTDVGVAQDLGTLIAGEDHTILARLIIGSILVIALLFYVFKARDFRNDKDSVLAGVVMGAVVLAAWVATSNIGVSADGETYSLRGFYDEWDFIAEEHTVKPSLGVALAPQSYTFINPIGQSVAHLTNGAEKATLTFGIAAAFGVIFGSFLWAVFTRRFRIEWFASFKDFLMHIVGATFMGFGGVLGMGCTIGQGVTGVSTLALGSIITLVSIILSSALTMKIQYYKMVYEDEASFIGALLSSLADMHLLPNGLRTLEKV